MTELRAIEVDRHCRSAVRVFWVVCAIWSFVMTSLGCDGGTQAPPSRDDPGGAALALLASGEASEAIRPVPSSREQVYRALAERLGAEIADSGVAGGALAIVEEKRVAFVAGLGLRQAGGTDPVDGDTLFRIGSITKTFTATAAAQLDAEGVLSLDAPITRYVPELKLHPPHDPRRITLRMLLSHTAGVPEHVEPECATGDDALGAWFEAHPNLTLWTPPGRLHSYSNLGYSLAGHVLERAAGVPFRQLLDELIFAPLRLDSMTFDQGEVEASGNYAVGRSQAGDTGWTFSSCALTDPPGYLWSSATDLARFAATLLSWGDGVLDARGLWQTRTPHVSTQGPPDVFYGLGLAIWRRNGVRMVWHNGGMPGFRAAMWTVPERGAAVVLLVNGDGFDPDAGALSALAELLDLPSEPPRDWSTPPSDWVRYVGVYAEPDAASLFPEPEIGTVAIELDQDTLFLRWLGDETRYPLQQLARDTWLVGLDGIQLPFTFWRDHTGRAEWIASRAGAARRVREPRETVRAP